MARWHPSFYRSISKTISIPHLWRLWLSPIAAHPFRCLRTSRPCSSCFKKKKKNFLRPFNTTVMPNQTHFNCCNAWTAGLPAAWLLDNQDMLQNFRFPTLVAPYLLHLSSWKLPHCPLPYMREGRVAPICFQLKPGWRSLEERGATEARRMSVEGTKNQRRVSHK
jgi:hypothetical protein